MLLPPYDILNYWAAIQLTTKGVSPYIFADFSSQMEAAIPGEIVFPFNYPPPALFWFLPLAFLDLESAAIVWRLLLVINYIFAFKIILGIFRDKFKFSRSIVLLLLPTIGLFPFYDWL